MINEYAGGGFANNREMSAYAVGHMRVNAKPIKIHSAGVARDRKRAIMNLGPSDLVNFLSCGKLWRCQLDEWHPYVRHSLRMIQRIARPLLMVTLFAGAVPAHSQNQPAVVPPHEHQHRGQQVTVTQGVLAVKRLGGQPLGPDFPALRGRELRVRELTIAPGGSIALHRHDQRPGVAYILEGQMTERRGPGFAPQVIGPGEAAFEGSGVSHWWRNEGSTPARALVIDIVPEETP